MSVKFPIPRHFWRFHSLFIFHFTQNGPVKEDTYGSLAGKVQRYYTSGSPVFLEACDALNVPIAELLADNLDSADKIDDSDLRYILLDCTSQEEKIITKAAKALKAILSAHGV